MSNYITPPANQGQIVTVSYCAIEDGVIERSHDASNNERWYRFASWAAVQGEYQPQNEAPKVRAGGWKNRSQIEAMRMIDESGPVRLA